MKVKNKLKLFDNRIPFYYEMKIIVILWLVSPATKGSTMFYSKLLHPFLIKREQARNKNYNN